MQLSPLYPNPDPPEADLKYSIFNRKYSIIIEVSDKTMNEKTEENPESSGGAQPKWWALSFDSTTNFSLLGWLLNKLKGRRNEKNNVDLTLED